MLESAELALVGGGVELAVGNHQLRYNIFTVIIAIVIAIISTISVSFSSFQHFFHLF